MQIFKKIYINQKIDFDECSAKKNLHEIHYQFEVNYRNLLFQFLLHRSGDYFNEIYFSDNYNLILRLLQYDTGESQKELKTLSQQENVLVNLELISDTFFLNLISLILDSYNPSSSVSKSEDYKVAYSFIKILKYLCEEHNNYFQKKILLLEFNLLGDKKIRFFDMMLLILIKIMNLAGWDRVKSNENQSIDYFYDIFSSIIELLIEIIQGNLQECFSIIYNNDQLNESKSNESESNVNYVSFFLMSIKTILFRDSPEIKIIYNIRKDLIDFLLAFLEEQNCSNKIKRTIITSYTIKDIVISICSTLKKIYIKCKEGNEEKTEEHFSIKANFVDNIFNHKDIKDKNVKKYKDCSFNEKLFAFFVKKYYEDEDFSESSEFQLANNMYKLLKYMEIQMNPEATNIFNRIKETEKDLRVGGKNSAVILDKEFSEIYYTIQFFEKFSKVIEISKVSESEGQDNHTITIIYTEKPLINYLSEASKTNFLENVDRKSRYTKLFEMSVCAETFKQEIEYNSLYVSSNRLLLFFNKLNYQYVDLSLFFISLLINILMVTGEFNEYGPFGITETYYNNGPDAVERKRISFIYRYVYQIISIIGLILAGCVLTVWFITKFPLYYQIEKKNRIDLKQKMQDEANLDEIKLTKLEKIFVVGLLYSVYNKKELRGILIFILFNMLALIFSSYWIILSFSLFILVNLMSTLDNIAIAIKLKFEQLLTALIFVFIITYVYAIIAFYFLNDQFVRKVGNNEVAECSSLVYCFFTNLNYGIRVTAGIGDILPRRSFFRLPDIYMQRFFFDVIYFALVVVIMLNIVFGIIIDTFRALRIKDQYTEFDINNVCFICGVKREELEKNKISYDKHINEIHSIWNYMSYIIGLLFEDPQELNANNSYVLQMLEKKNINWFPEAKS